MSQELDPKYYTGRLLHLAKDEMKRSRCRCGEAKERKVIALHEFGDPHIPSSVLIYCSKCHFATPFAVRPYEEAKRWAEYVMKQEGASAPQKLTDKILDLSILGQGKIPTSLPKEEPGVIKDEDNKIIADRKTVAKKDKIKKI